MASNTIKGLTVEIGGDTTKLGKALKNVESQSRSLSKELGDINKLLKLDPGNTDLLAQKQEVLARAVETTRKKLDTLKEAEKQVQKQFQRGEVSEEQVRALQREIVATTNKMEGYEKAARETAQQLEKLGNESKETSKRTRDTEEGAEDAADSLDEMAESADKAGDASDGLAGKLGGLVKGGLAALTAGVTAAVGAMVGSAEATREYRAEMGKLDTAFTTAGHTSEAAYTTYKQLQGVLGETDQSVEAAGHLAKLADNAEDLATWTGIATGVYATFGASLPIESLTEAANETAKTGQLTGALADALNWAGMAEDDFQLLLDNCTTEQERQAIIMTALNGLYGDAADKYKETNKEIIRANEANEAWTASMAEVGEAVEPVLTDIKLLGASLLSDLVPGVAQVAEAFRGLLNGDGGAATDLGAALSGIFENLLTKLTDILPQVADMAVSLITTLTTSIIGALPRLASTGIQIIVSLIQGITQAMPQIVSAAATAIPQLIGGILTALPQLLTTGGQLIGQLLSGISSALPQVAEKAIFIIGGLVSGLQQNLPRVLEEGAKILTNLVQGISQNLPALVSQALDVIMNFATTIYDNAPMLIETGFNLLGSLIQGILDTIPVLLSKAPEIISKFANVINDNFPTILKKGVELIGQIIMGLIQAIPTLVANIPKIITAIVDVWEAFNWVNLGKKAITALKDGVLKMVGSVKTAGKNITEGLTNALKNLPTQLANFGRNAMTNLSSALRNGLSAVKSGATNIFNAVVNTIKSLPSKMLSIGKDLVKGLWNGISDMVGWITGKIQSFGDSVLSGIKDFFGINSPSRVMQDEVGVMLSRGVAEGITDGEDYPVRAMADLSAGLMDEADELNGLTLERKLHNTFTAPAAAAADSGMLGTLDKILEAIERGQVLTIDGAKLVGATAGQMDSTLGQRRALVARGAV